MTIELVKILEAAQSYKESGDRWFELYTNSLDKIDYQTSLEYDAKCRGMLEAYEILTGKKIYIYEIDKELALC